MTDPRKLALAGENSVKMLKPAISVPCIAKTPRVDGRPATGRSQLERRHFGPPTAKHPLAMS